MEQRVYAIQAAFEERGVKPAEFIDEFVHTAEEKWIPPNGASVVAKAWTDPAFKERLLANGRDAVAKLGLPLSIDIRVWDTTADTRYMVLPVLPRDGWLVFNMGEYRHAIERMEPRHYLSASYCERSLTGLATLCVATCASTPRSCGPTPSIRHRSMSASSRATRTRGIAAQLPAALSGPM